MVKACILDNKNHCAGQVSNVGESAHISTCGSYSKSNLQESPFKSPHMFSEVDFFSLLSDDSDDVSGSAIDYICYRLSQMLIMDMRVFIFLIIYIIINILMIFTIIFTSLIILNFVFVNLISLTSFLSFSNWCFWTLKDANGIYLVKPSGMRSEFPLKSPYFLRRRLFFITQ